MKKSIFFLLSYLFTYKALPQRAIQSMYRYIDGFSITLNTGTNALLGELSSFEQPRIYGLLAIEKGITPIVHLKTHVQLGNLYGENLEPYQAYAQIAYYQWSIMSVINISQLVNHNNQTLFNVYLSTGLGFLRFHTDVYDLDNDSFLRTTADNTSRHTTLFQAQGVGVGDPGIYYTREWSIPIELSADYKLAQQLYLNLCLSYNWVNSDKLDGTTPYNLVDRTKVDGQNHTNDAWLGLRIGLKYKFVSLKRMLQRGI